MYETPKIDVHGMDRAAACSLVTANLAVFRDRGYYEVFIVHGKGAGILRSSIRVMLRRFAYIKKIRSGTYREGGDGVTVVSF
jgi:DNA mismatch repair protein MutS2